MLPLSRLATRHPIENLGRHLKWTMAMCGDYDALRKRFVGNLMLERTKIAIVVASIPNPNCPHSKLASHFKCEDESRKNGCSSVAIDCKVEVRCRGTVAGVCVVHHLSTT